MWRLLPVAKRAPGASARDLLSDEYEGRGFEDGEPGRRKVAVY